MDCLSKLLKKDRYWDLLTNVSTRTIIAGQKERWSIEEIFKWLKQQIDFKNPDIECALSRKLSASVKLINDYHLSNRKI